MQEFLSGSAFEQMAREYNAKYGKANVLQSSFNGQEQLTKEKEKEILEIKKDFEEISSLFLFLKKYISRFKTNIFNAQQNFCFNKINELEGKINKLKSKFYNF